MSRKAKTVAELYEELLKALTRQSLASSPHNVSVCRDELDRIEKAIIRAARREQRDGELS